MNTRFRTSFFFIFLIIASLTASSCGMRRALTLPPKEKAEREFEEKVNDIEKSEEK